MYICVCNAVTDREIRAAAQLGARTLEDLQCYARRRDLLPPLHRLRAPACSRAPWTRRLRAPSAATTESAFTGAPAPLR